MLESGVKGKAAVVIGGAGDIGIAVVRCLLSAGCRVALADNDTARLAELKEDFADRDDVLTREHDAADAESAVDIAHACVESFRRLDFLVYAAGVYPEAQFEDIAAAQWERTIAVNLSGAFLAAQACVDRMRDGGAIVNIASMAAHTGSVAHADYASSKGGVVALTRSMARELGPEIRANAVSPGVIDTRLAKGALITQNEALLSQIPMQRLGTPDDVAAATLFLLSDRASYITGETLQVNGGLRIQ